MRSKAAILTSKLSIYDRFQRLSFTQKFAIALMGAALTGVLAQVRVPLPFTPVPMTLQVLGVLGAGLLMGSMWGTISMLMYALIGAMGMPWFTGASGGIQHIMGPTGGYIVGFIAAAYIAGLVAERIDSPIGSLLGSVLGIALIYTFGVLGLMAYGMSLPVAIAKGVVPFIVVDTIKGIFAGGFSAVVR